MRLYEEDEIVWLHGFDKAGFPMVREGTIPKGTRRRPFPIPDQGDGRVLVGYAVLKPDAPAIDEGWGRARFYRRFFYIMPHDFEPFSPEGKQMTRSRCEGVDPMTIAPRQAGQKTPRSSRPATARQRATMRAILKRAQPKPKSKKKRTLKPR